VGGMFLWIFCIFFKFFNNLQQSFFFKDTNLLPLNQTSYCRGKKNMTRDIASVNEVADKLHAVTDKLHAVADKLHAVTDKLHAVTDKLHAVKVKLHAVTDKLHAATDKLHAATDKLHEVTDNFSLRS
jgi:ABC-type transporter Mla subunit MlaD